MPERNGVWYCDQCGKRVEDDNCKVASGRFLCSRCAAAASVDDDLPLTAHEMEGEVATRVARGSRNKDDAETAPSIQAAFVFIGVMVIIGVLCLGAMIIRPLEGGTSEALYWACAGLVLFAQATFFALVRRGVIALVRLEHRN